MRTYRTVFRRVDRFVKHLAPATTARSARSPGYGWGRSCLVRRVPASPHGERSGTIGLCRAAPPLSSALLYAGARQLARRRDVPWHVVGGSRRARADRGRLPRASVARVVQDSRLEAELAEAC